MALLIKVTAILFLLFISFFSTHLHAYNTEGTHDHEDNDDEYILDAPLHRLRSRFLASIKKGTKCSPNNSYYYYGSPKNNNKCNKVPANKGTSLLDCCKGHCRDILGDANNCGKCGHKCRLGQLCCHGICTDVGYNRYHCGKCDKVCKSGLRCTYGFCGYA